MDFYRRVVPRPGFRDGRGGGASGRSADADARDPARRRARGGRARPRAPRPARALLRRGQRRARHLRALPFEFEILRLRFEPWRPADILSLGKLLSFGLSTNWERELLRADMVRALGADLTARLDPAYPAENPIATQDRWSATARPGRADRRRPRALGMAVEAGGSNNWAVRAPSARPEAR